MGLGTGWNKCAPSLNQTGWQLGEDTHGDDDRHSISDAALGDLVAKPHQQQRAGSHRDDGHELEPKTRGRNKRQSDLVDRVHDAGEERICLGILKGTSQEISLENAKADCGVSGVLHDFLPATVFTGELAKLRNHSR